MVVFTCEVEFLTKDIDRLIITSIAKGEVNAENYHVKIFLWASTFKARLLTSDPACISAFCRSEVLLSKN